MKKIIFIFILFNIISLNLFGKYKYEDFYKTVDLSKCKSAGGMLETLENCHNVGAAINSGTSLWGLVVEISHFVDYYYYMIGAYKYLINYYNMGDEYTKELMKDIYNVCSNFKLSGVSSYKEKKEYTSYEFAALLFNNSKEYTIDDYMSIINFGYRTNVLSREYLLRFIYMQTNKLLIDFIDKESEGMNIKVEDKKFMADFYKYGFVGILQEWIEDGMKEEPEIIIKKLTILLKVISKKH